MFIENNHTTFSSLLSQNTAESNAPGMSNNAQMCIVYSDKHNNRITHPYVYMYSSHTDINIPSRDDVSPTVGHSIQN